MARRVGGRVSGGKKYDRQERMLTEAHYMLLVEVMSAISFRHRYTYYFCFGRSACESSPFQESGHDVTVVFTPGESPAPARHEP